MRAKAIELGNELVSLLESKPRGNMLTRWMAYYLGEQLALAEDATGEIKIAAEDRCFETILKLWHHRAYWPRGMRPFENFERIFHTLLRLNPDEPRAFYYHRVNADEDIVGEEAKDIATLMQVVESIDAAARALIEAAVKSAVAKAKSNTTKKLISGALFEKPADDVKVVRHLIREDEGEEAIAQRIAEVKRRIERLDSFVEISKSIRSVFSEELRLLQHSKHPVSKKTAKKNRTVRKAK